MKRRDFLKYLGTATSGLLLGARGRAALAAAAAAPAPSPPVTGGATPGAAAAASPAAAGASAVAAAAPGTAALDASPGVAAGVIRIGMSAAFQGTNAGLGTEYYRGSQAYYQEVNARGGIAGRRIEVVALDDHYDPIPTVRNTIQLVEKDRVFCLSNYVGTPTLTRALPVIKRYAGDDLLLVGDLTGAQPQREPPYASQVFNIRASYRQEMMALVERLWTAGVRRFGVFYQIDAYGRSGTDGVARGLARHGARIAAEATYRRGAAFDADMSVAAKHLRDAGVEAVLCTGAYQACGAFVRTARDLGWTVPISNVSFVGSESMSRLLLEHGRKTGRDYTARLVNSQVVPSYAPNSPLAGVHLYRSLMDKWQLEVPASLRDPKYRVEPYSFISFEGFINARVIVEGLRRAGPAPSRRSFKAALESIGQLDLGIGAPLAFGPDRHQGLDEVYFTRLAGDAWVPVDDWSAVIHV
ncbi:MAG TPA: ABC transporter substrate-binding protein [Thermoanaerobaculia bacterium]|jgi:ABC-type branched-subunit amino acid transport system substrate-binding protein|nr:ABC transporter substrate-binding protein [Thermoanaerobaculia bacterium]